MESSPHKQYPCNHDVGSLAPRRDKCSNLAAIFGVLTVMAVLNCWWLLSLDLFQLFASSSSSSGSSNITGEKNNLALAHQPSYYTSHQADAKCDFADGRWVPDVRPPLYSNETCKYIHIAQNCMKNGRPDMGYLHWKWKPLHCELPDFDALLLLGLMRDKKMAFIGDSIARNHMQSLLCALSQVEDPQNVYFDVNEKEATWHFASYNFILANIWSPFLVNHTFFEDVYHVHLDLPDITWSSLLHDYDIAILSTGYWYFRPIVYYMDNMTLGMNPNLTTFDKLPAMKIAWETVLNHMVNNFNGITVLRTVTVPHFHSGSWSNGGYCNDTQPLLDPRTQEPFPWMSHAIVQVQSQELSKALDHIRARKGKEAMSRLRVLNITYSSFLRPDGHPNSYRIHTQGEPRNDCLHWCLPGPIDMWNQVLLKSLQGLVL